MRTWADTRCKLSNLRIVGFSNSNPSIRKSVNRSISMPDPAEQLQRLYLAGFDLERFDRYPKCVGVVRDHCIALLVPDPNGLQVLGTPGWKMGEVMGVLVEKEGRQVFQSKEELVEATPERLDEYEKFRRDLTSLLKSPRE
jgi:hypothetical protein